MSQQDMAAYAALIAALAKELGLDGEAADEHGYFRIEVEGCPVTILRQGDAALLYSSLGALPPDPAEAEAMRRLFLSANVVFRGTSRATLAVAPEDNAAVLCRQLPLKGLTDGEFIMAVESFITEADNWTGKLAAPAGGAENANPAAPTPPAGPGPWDRA